MSDLDGGRALLTGGLGSLGRAQAARLVRAGAAVTILDRPDAEGGADRAADLGCNWLGCDLNDLAGARAKVAGCAPFDILINNAALIVNQPFETFSLAEYEEQLRVNSSAAFALVQACAPTMKAKGTGRIVNFTSLTLRGILGGYVPYVASKGAMLGLTKALARELGPHGITVNAVSPGSVVSDSEARIFGHRAAESAQYAIDHQCLKSRIHPHHVADLVHFLVSPAAEMITGQDIAIDGGW
jgi:NAD(P)-dependent dehydrogenase (short-subunit alcohol dehydrogenase family)